MSDTRELEAKVATLRESMRLDAETMAAKDRRIAEIERDLAAAMATIERGVDECLQSGKKRPRSIDELTEVQANFALALLDSARQEITPVPGETAALCRAIDEFMQTGVVPDNCLGLATEEHARGRTEVSAQELAEDAEALRHQVCNDDARDALQALCRYMRSMPPSGSWAAVHDPQTIKELRDARRALEPDWRPEHGWGDWPSSQSVAGKKS